MAKAWQVEDRMIRELWSVESSDEPDLERRKEGRRQRGAGQGGTGRTNDGMKLRLARMEGRE